MPSRRPPRKSESRSRRTHSTRPVKRELGSSESALLAELVAKVPDVSDPAALTLALTEFLAELRTWNARGNLVSHSDLSRLVSRHVAEALAVVPVVDRLKVTQILDLGSGGGFPIIPVKLARSELAVGLVESRRMKSLFLRRVTARLELQRLWVWSMRAESLAGLPPSSGHSSLETVGGSASEETPASRPVVDLVTARAVASLSDLTRWSSPLVRPGGWLLTFKGSRLDQELQDWRREPGPWELESVTPSEGDSRHVLLRRL